ncbi:MinD/ParA family ATP-binding protein [Parachitinimonas caeni]|uniref:AAA family ATPase n=1 Tax=Parachitinimonas caeni TaxID=3031301 RepID=A0ABT7DW41_9NEIS|nr:cellulose synthase operon protein YhjQ/BcsQ [Parachitinimonas caeni]MDK2124280.1 AAA family ATPase [Parachitinimonas caeni]
MHSGDQAAGLRDLVEHGGSRAICCFGAHGTGVTSMAINLAAALAHHGKRVMLVDESRGNESAVARLQLNQRFTFDHVLGRDVRLSDLPLQAPGGIELLPLQASQQVLAGISPIRQRQLADEFDSIAACIDLHLIDGRPAQTDEPPSLALASDDMIVVITPHAESITEAYASIKLLNNEYGRREFWILANRVRTLETARALFRRIKEVAGRYLGARLRLMGFVPEDERLHRANRLGRPVTDAFPDAEASIAFDQLADAMLRWPPAAIAQGDRANLLYRAIDGSRKLALDATL